MNYEWDTNKAANNVTKHGVTFEEAVTVFDDSLAAFFDDVLHSDDESRYLLVGFSSQNRLLFVSHTSGNAIDSIRIISARLATKREREKHERETIG